jgi:hypothetical protein
VRRDISTGKGHRQPFRRINISGFNNWRFETFVPKVQKSRVAIGSNKEFRISALQVSGYKGDMAWGAKSQSVEARHERHVEKPQGGPK